MDGNTQIGGFEGGMSPMELLLAACGGCSLVDIEGILQKQKQNLESIEVVVDGDRVQKETYSEYQAIHLHYELVGDLDEGKVEKAINLSLEKYCSVTKTLGHTANITSSFTVIA